MRRRKKFLLVAILVFLVLFSALFHLVNPVGGPTGGSAGRIDLGQGKNLIPVIDQMALKKHVQTLVDIKPHRSVEDWSSLDLAADYIKSEWSRMGLKVEEQKYLVGQKSARNLIVKMVPEGINAGSASDPWIVIGAHYDVCMDLPGADDNASGVAGLLELSRALSQSKLNYKRPIMLVAWTLEEPPYYDTEWMGSFVHAKSLKDSKQEVALAISLEMIGFFKEEPRSQDYPVGLLKLLYPTVGNFIAMVGHTQMWSETRQAKRQMINATDIDVRSINTFGLIPGIDWSDHRSFWTFGYPALMITDTSFFRTPHYHQATDTVETLNFSRMAQVVQGVYGIATGY